MRQICPPNSHAVFDTGTDGRTDDGTNLGTRYSGILPATPVAQSPPRRLRICAGRSRSLGEVLLCQASDEEGTEQNRNEKVARISFKSGRSRVTAQPSATYGRSLLTVPREEKRKIS